MLDFVCVILPGIFFTFVAEALQRKKLSFHDFCFLAVTNVLAMNLITLGMRFFVADFLYMETSELTLGDAFAAASAIKYLLAEVLVGIVLSVAEAFAGKYINLRLEITEEKAGAAK